MNNIIFHNFIIQNPNFTENVILNVIFLTLHHRLYDGGIRTRSILSQSISGGWRVIHHEQIGESTPSPNITRPPPGINIQHVQRLAFVRSDRLAPTQDWRCGGRRHNVINVNDVASGTAAAYDSICFIFFLIIIINLTRGRRV
ncbi:hypothetical protein Hanom_Chr11g01016561 [Helianthus anomalus]